MVIIKYFHIVERTYVPWPEQSHLMEENKISGLNKNCLPYFLLFTSQWHRSHSPESLPIRIAAIIKINIIYYIMKITKRSTKHCNVSPNCLCICHKLSQQLTSDDQFQLIVIHFPFLITCRFLDITTYTQFQRSIIFHIRICIILYLAIANFAFIMYFISAKEKYSDRRLPIKSVFNRF